MVEKSEGLKDARSHRAEVVSEFEELNKNITHPEENHSDQGILSTVAQKLGFGKVCRLLGSDFQGVASSDFRLLE